MSSNNTELNTALMLLGFLDLSSLNEVQLDKNFTQKQNFLVGYNV
jgi:hypothetical protein